MKNFFFGHRFHVWGVGFSIANIAGLLVALDVLKDIVF